MREATLYHHDLITEDELALRHSRSLGKNCEAFVARGAPTSGQGAKDVTPAWQRVHEPPVPLLMIYGREDRGNAAERAALLKQRHSNVNLHLVDGCKHIVPWDAADAYVHMTVEFLNAPS